MLHPNGYGSVPALGGASCRGGCGARSMEELEVPLHPRLSALVRRPRIRRSCLSLPARLAAPVHLPQRSVGLVLAALLGCGGDGLTLPDQGTPSAIAVVR